MGYGMIAKVGSILVKLLAEHMVPDVILSPDNIGLCSPAEHGDMNLGIFLYHIAENLEILRPGMVNSGLRTQTCPSTFLDLYYMITAYSTSDLKFRASEEQRILGKVVQVFRDYNVLPEHVLGEGARFHARIEMCLIEQQQRAHIWNFPGVPYKFSLLYRVGPVEIASAREKEITRVTDVGFMVREEEGR